MKICCSNFNNFPKQTIINNKFCKIIFIKRYSKGYWQFKETAVSLVVYVFSSLYIIIVNTVPKMNFNIQTYMLTRWSQPLASYGNQLTIILRYSKLNIYSASSRNPVQLQSLLQSASSRNPVQLQSLLIYLNVFYFFLQWIVHLTYGKFWILFIII